MRYLTLVQLLEIHQRVIQQSGGAAGILRLDGLEAALAQPRQTFEAVELHATLVEKAAALGYALISNHPFVDGNKRTGHAAVELFLLLNEYEIRAGIDEQEQLILGIAAGRISRQEFAEWLSEHMVHRGR